MDRRGELYVSLGVNRWLINVEGRVSDIKELGFFIGLNLKGNFLLFLWFNISGGVLENIGKLKIEVRFWVRVFVFYFINFFKY